ECVEPLTTITTLTRNYAVDARYHHATIVVDIVSAQDIMKEFCHGGCVGMGAHGRRRPLWGRSDYVSWKITFLSLRVGESKIVGLHSQGCVVQNPLGTPHLGPEIARNAQSVDRILIARRHGGGTR